MPSRRKERVINSLVSFRVAKLFLSQVRVLISVHRELKLCVGVEDYSMEVKLVHATIIYYTILCLFVFTRNIHNMKRTQADHIRSRRNTTVIGEKLLLTSMVTSRGTVGTVEQDFIWPPVLYS